METIRELSELTGRRWLSIEKASTDTDALLDRIRAAVAGIETSDSAMIVTGSLGRGEVTPGSDVDWFLLVDGQSKTDAREMLNAIDRQLKDAGLKEPGRSGTFGQLVSSHELVHYIAGTRDTNENLTRRVLLLAESRAVTGEVVRRRVIGNILARYVVYDRVAPDPAATRTTIPHFLLNDLVRYWRTMASDYASKMWERSREGWAIRNIKLRFSRKLILVWGFLASFSWELFPGDVRPEDLSEEAWLLLLAAHVREQTDIRPLDMLGRALLGVNDEELTAKILDAYDSFLAFLSDSAGRDRLEELPFGEAAQSADFQRLRALSHEFRDGINELFFEKHEKLTKLIRRYGVF